MKQRYRTDKYKYHSEKEWYFFILECFTIIYYIIFLHNLIFFPIYVIIIRTEIFTQQIFGKIFFLEGLCTPPDILGGKHSMKDKEWILEHLEICGYQVEEITYLGGEEIEKMSYERLYLVKLNFFGELVERIVYKHGQCLDMISKNIQVKDMLGKADKIFFPRSNGQNVGLAERRPLMENDLTPDTVLFYEDYVLLREHFFTGRHLLQVVCWVRTDDCKLYLDCGKYGHYKPSIITGVAEAV